MEAAALSAPDGSPLTWPPGASFCPATPLLLQIIRSSCIVLHGVDLEFSPVPRGNHQHFRAQTTMDATALSPWHERLLTRSALRSEPVGVRKVRKVRKVHGSPTFRIFRTFRRLVNARVYQPTIFATAARIGEGRSQPSIFDKAVE
jgi:hypothetical protein